jgi:outer membrane protein
MTCPEFRQKMKYFRTLFTLISIASAILAQSPEVSIQTPPPPRFIGPLLRPFHLEKRVVAPATLANTPRLDMLVRAGNLYLSAQDVIALTLENNLDIAIQRYGPAMAREVLRRTQSGNFLRSDVTTPILQGPESVSTTGVSTSGNGFASGAGLGSTAGFVIGYGPNPPNLDPNITANVQFGHTTTPESNTIAAGTSALVTDSRYYSFAYSQGFVTGTNMQLSYTSYRNLLNSPNFILNPYTGGDIDFQINQSLLQGFGRAVNNRNIRIARNNIKVTDLSVKLQAITTISAVLNLYWDLVSFNEDLRIKQQALATAQKLYEDNQNRARLGELPAIEVTRAAAEVSSRKEDLLLSQTNLAQQETVLKNALSRNGVESAWFDDIHIIPLERIEVPKTDDLRPTADLIQYALQNRPDLEQTKINLDSSKINLQGTKNSLLPNLSAFAELTNNALAGSVNSLYSGCCGPASTEAYFVGGYGSLLAQEFRRNFPNYSAGFSLSIPLRNRAAQGDYVKDQLQIAQNELQLQRATNQIRVDVKNAVIGLQQARARYEAAVSTRQLAEQSLQAEQNLFQFGESNPTLLIQAQEDLATDQTLEIEATRNYTHAKLFLDQAVGQTLDVNHVSLEEAASGRVARQSVLPGSVPDGER